MPHFRRPRHRVMLTSTSVLIAAAVIAALLMAPAGAASSAQELEVVATVAAQLATPAATAAAAAIAHELFQADQQRVTHEPHSAPRSSPTEADAERPPARPTCASAAEEARASLAAGAVEACAVTTEGRALCWGDRVDALMVPPGAHAGQVSVVARANTQVFKWMYTDSGYNSDTTLMATGGVGACALSERNKATCWGADAEQHSSQA